MSVPPGPWAPPTGHSRPAPGSWPPAQPPAGQFAEARFTRTQMPTGPVPPAPGFGGQWPGPGHWAGPPTAAPMPRPTRPGAPARRRRGPVAMVSVLLLVLLAVAGGAWVVSTGHTPGTVGASSGSPLAAPRTPSPLPANPLAGAGSGGFCQIARDTVAKQGATPNDPNTELTAMLDEARATNRRLAAAAPAELRADFAVFQQVSDQLADLLTSGTQPRPESLQGMMSPRFLAAVEHITGYAKTRCGIRLDSLTPPGLGG